MRTEIGDTAKGLRMLFMASRLKEAIETRNWFMYGDRRGHLPEHDGLDLWALPYSDAVIQGRGMARIRADEHGGVRVDPVPVEDTIHLSS